MADEQAWGIEKQRRELSAVTEDWSNHEKVMISDSYTPSKMLR